MPRSQPAISSSVRLRAASQRQARRASALRTRSAASPASAPRSASTRGSSARRSRSRPYAPTGSPSPSNGCAEQRRIGGIGVERHALVDDLLADARAAARLRERAPALVGGARVERAGEQRHQIGRPPAARAPPCRGPARSPAGCGSPPPSAPRCGRWPRGRRRPSRARPRCAQPLPVPSGVRAVIEKSASVVAVVGEQSAARRHGHRRGVRLEEAGDEDLARRLAGRARRRRPRAAPPPRASRDRDRRVRSTKRVRPARTSAGRAPASAPGSSGRQPRELRRQVHRPLQRRVVEHVGRRRRAAPADRRGHGDRRVGRRRPTS